MKRMLTKDIMDRKDYPLLKENDMPFGIGEKVLGSLIEQSASQSDKSHLQ